MGIFAFLKKLSLSDVHDTPKETMRLLSLLPMNTPVARVGKSKYQRSFLLSSRTVASVEPGPVLLSYFSHSKPR
jgi:hypothetical protein